MKNSELANSGFAEVQGPINREPDEKLGSVANKTPSSGIRRLYVLYFKNFIVIDINLVNLLDVRYLFFELLQLKFKHTVL